MPMNQRSRIENQESRTQDGKWLGPEGSAEGVVGETGGLLERVDDGGDVANPVARVVRSMTPRIEGAGLAVELGPFPR